VCRFRWLFVEEFQGTLSLPEHFPVCRVFNGGLVGYFGSLIALRYDRKPRLAHCPEPDPLG